jgi:high affinity choline transporter 7
VLPYVLRHLTPPAVAVIGLAAVAAAVMSSVDSSILSASSMAAWNLYRPLVNPDASSAALTRIVKRTVLVVGVAATLIALHVRSVYTLWVLCSDLVYCMLFPQTGARLVRPAGQPMGLVRGHVGGVRAAARHR